MYNKFFGLSEAPFNITPDSRFLFLSKRHREALGALVYGIRERKGFILLTGEIGAGKTTVCRALVHELRAENVRLAVILNPGLSELELLKAINDEFGIPSYYDTKKGLIDALNKFLISESRKGQNVVLIIDEAQNLEPALLEQIRMLSNLETEDTKLIQIVLMGQPELNETLALTQLEQLNQRIAVRYHLTPLTEEEMQAYIRHRLFVARAKIDVELTPGAVRLAYAATRGIPRRINVLMDRALLACYAEGSYTLDEHIMSRAVQDIAGELPLTSEDKSRGFSSGIGRLLTRWVAIGAGAVIAIGVLAGVAILTGIELANFHGNKPVVQNVAENDVSTTATVAGTALEDTTTTVAAAETPVPTPPPPPKDYDEIRRNNPNWKYEKNAPLVRVNNPRTVFRAAQLSILKTWGIAVELSRMAELDDSVITQGNFTSDKVTIRTIPISGGYQEAIRFNVPLIVKLLDPAANESEYVVLLQAQGEQVTIGDPMWGVRTDQTSKFIPRFAGAQTLFVDTYQLSTLQRGDRSDRVRQLQSFLKEFLETKNPKDVVEVSGVYDVKTSNAVKRFQTYYGLPETGQLDNLTMLLLNAGMMRNGPRLSSAEVSR